MIRCWRSAAFIMKVQKFLYRAIGTLLLVPSSLFCLMLSLGATALNSAAAIIIQILALYSYLCVWRFFLNKLNTKKLVASKFLKVGWWFSPIYGALLLGLNYQGLLGEISGIYYFSLAPSLCLALGLLLPLENHITTTSKFSFHSTSAFERMSKQILLLLGYVWSCFILLLLIIAMLGAYATHNIGAVSEFLLPTNVTNWIMIFVLFSPSYLMIKLGRPSW